MPELHQTSPWVFPLAVSGCVALSSLAVAVLSSTSLFGEKKNTPEDIEALIVRRRTIQPATFSTEEKVPREIIERMLEGANWAPTHGKTEPWRFIVYSGDKALKDFAAFDAQVYKDTATKLGSFSEKKYLKRTLTKVRSSHVIAIIMKRGTNPNVPEIEEIAAASCAAQNMYLIATKYNVGVYWSTNLSVYTPEMHDYLGLGPEDKCLGLFCVGVPTKPHPVGHRKDIKDKVQWVHQD